VAPVAAVVGVLLAAAHRNVGALGQVDGPHAPKARTLLAAAAAVAVLLSGVAGRLLVGGLVGFGGVEGEWGMCEGSVAAVDWPECARCSLKPLQTHKATPRFSNRSSSKKAKHAPWQHWDRT